MPKQRVWVQRNPKSWRLPYSVRADTASGSKGLIVSQHRNKANAQKAAKKVSTKNVSRVLGFIK